MSRWVSDTLIGDDWVKCRVRGPLGVATCEGPLADGLRVIEHASYLAGYRAEP
jgi:hypothetical protein